MAKRNINDIKKMMAELSDEQLTTLLMEEIVSKMTNETIAVQELIINFSIITEKLITLGIITNERGFRLAVSSSQFINDFMKQQHEQ